MPVRPGWYEDYWKNMDKDTAKKMRTTCPKCGSANTYYNKQFKVWRCGKCEHAFLIKGVSSRTAWWKRIFGLR